MWAPGYEYLATALSTAKSITLAKTEGEGIVFLYPELNVVVKQRYPYDTPKHQVKWEYDVGLLINAYNNPNMVKTLGYYMTENVASIVTEYVPGVTLNNLETEHHTKELYTRILHAIHRAQEQMEFTHHDLHPGNIILEPNDNIRFIDYARTHVRGVQSGWFETGIIDAATCPGIFDPMFDYATIATKVELLRISLPRKLMEAPMREMLVNNYFSPGDVDHDESCRMVCYTGYPYVIYYDGKLNVNDIAWASTTETLEGSPGGYTGDDYKTLGAICLGVKLRQMRIRRNTPEEFYQACLEFISRRLQ